MNETHAIRHVMRELAKMPKEGRTLQVHRLEVDGFLRNVPQAHPFPTSVRAYTDQMMSRAGKKRRTSFDPEPEFREASSVFGNWLSLVNRDVRDYCRLIDFFLYNANEHDRSRLLTLTDEFDDLIRGYEAMSIPWLPRSWRSLSKEHTHNSPLDMNVIQYARHYLQRALLAI